MAVVWMNDGLWHAHGRAHWMHDVSADMLEYKPMLGAESYGRRGRLLPRKERVDRDLGCCCSRRLPLPSPCRWQKLCFGVRCRLQCCLVIEELIYHMFRVAVLPSIRCYPQSSILELIRRGAQGAGRPPLHITIGGGWAWKKRAISISERLVRFGEAKMGQC